MTKIVAGSAWHDDVEKNKVGFFNLNCLDSFVGVRSRSHVIPARSKQFSHQQEGVELIVDHQNCLRFAAWRAGAVARALNHVFHSLMGGRMCISELHKPRLPIELLLCQYHRAMRRKSLP